ncbi:tRNA uridine(34) 5-carboxymethylaminomethyl synthesis GTPase MnmE [Oleiphilus sp. HI0009]|uniref:tRNA uridine-5-carboxymethylaminomethyl(34) synthesis GTPase MnmE n=2 Tax=Oleiphilus TaxID=141450 RepID=UPI0007C2E6B5|nr:MULTISPECIES: tRNA uridine-5-carboxymethylaminomethyl(34) synthesis GTPase MnmE [unclassified Oleiphilus]KZX73511.1 tRNA uridine(34) 5-carboxymethylaminomethyl synthesis GTPase MnmE [Oleiphilus sp. HI0009]KZY70082.1 tRNA uridine(34) 5-carboxymethylaminomethyl synthesis GTPase MnmE [Oleiphilus sp. HI0066]KZY71612.1 tRNA uridine(34) 5-carboxymethylaminomethyl synthesis GTPase MnmE [Oleiphilus sp. HI0067]
MTDYHSDTIAAIATATGRGGVGIVRISGEKAVSIAQSFLRQSPTPRQALYSTFFDENGQAIDQGIGLYFKAPHSFTGEDVFELQAHGGPVVLDMLLNTCLAHGARLAEPGEFTQRAFLNDKIDLVQAEAIADLIDSNSEAAARSALRSLHGDFSKRITSLTNELIKIRMFVEAAIDFPEEEIDFLADSQVLQQLDGLILSLERVLSSANQGALLTEGVRVVIAGRPNAGKSSLLNALAGTDSAIVTDIEGTTRDVLKEQINLDGLPLHIIDTAGLRDSSDKVEQIGIERAWAEINQADLILLVFDGKKEPNFDPKNDWNDFLARLDRQDHIFLVQNKIDQTSESSEFVSDGAYPLIRLSAKLNNGVDLLKQELKSFVGFKQVEEGTFTARRRHLNALDTALTHVRLGRDQLVVANAGELLAEDLRLAQEALSTITGRFSPDDLLGEIFGSFCIGK